MDEYAFTLGWPRQCPCCAHPSQVLCSQHLSPLALRRASRTGSLPPARAARAPERTQFGSSVFLYGRFLSCVFLCKPLHAFLQGAPGQQGVSVGISNRLAAPQSQGQVPSTLRILSSSPDGCNRHGCSVGTGATIYPAWAGPSSRLLSGSSFR